MNSENQRAVFRVRAFELARFIVIGGACFLLGLLLVYLLTDQAGLHYLVSLSVSMLIANFVGWLLNRAWTFGVAHPRSRQEFLRYLAVNLAGFAVTLVAVHFLVSRAGLHYLWASGCVAAGMTLINFIAHRHISFRLP